MDTPVATSAAGDYVIDFDTTLPAGYAEEQLVALPPPADGGGDALEDEFGLELPAHAANQPPDPPSRLPMAGAAVTDSMAPLLMRASAAAEDRPGPASVLPAGQAAQARQARRDKAAQRRQAAITAPPAVEAPPEPVEDEPEFVRSSRLREETGARKRLLLLGGCVLLALFLLAQGVTNFRNVLAARYPGAKPLLSGVCAVIGCKVELPAQIDALAVEAGELQSLDADTFSFTTLLRNQGELVQAWPHLELALTDANDKTLVRRVFTPADYLPAGSAPAKGFAARSEQPVKLFFQLRQIKASGYHVAIFYP